MPVLPPENINSFLSDNTIFTLATSRDCSSHCAICFYAYSPDAAVIIFKSSKDSEHILNATENRDVSGSVISPSLNIATLKGLQFKGQFFSDDHESKNDFKKIYYKKFPFATIIPGDIWMIRLTKIKLTDNSLRFGKKTSWELF